MAPDSGMQETIIKRLADVNELFRESNTSSELLKALKQASNVLNKIMQSPEEAVLSAMKPCMTGLAHPKLLQHEDKEIQLFVAVCLSEIIRIVAPDVPYPDDLLRDIFALVVSTFKRLSNTSSPYFANVLCILQTVARVRSCVVMLDLNCEDLILEMFQIFFSTVGSDPQRLMVIMKTIMCLVLEENDEDNLQPLLDIIFRNLLGEREGVSEAASYLAGAICEQCAQKLGPWAKQFMDNMIEGSWWKERHNDLIWAIYKSSPSLLFEVYKLSPQLLAQILDPVLPKLTDELLADELDARLKAVKILGCVFVNDASNELKPSVKGFIKSFADKSAEVRRAAVEIGGEILMAYPNKDESVELLNALCDRLQDGEVDDREVVIAAICNVAKENRKLIPQHFLRRVGDGLLDPERSVRQKTLRELIEVYQTFCQGWNESSAIELESFSWIPCQILRYCSDKDSKELGGLALELILSEELFPASLSVKNRVECWVEFFSCFEQSDMKALERFLSQKQRIQIEMKNYLLAKEKLKEEKSLENQKIVEDRCKAMANLLTDSDNADKRFQKFNNLKETTFMHSFDALLDPCSSFDDLVSIRDGLLKKLGKKHQLYEFVRVLATKCSYMLFSKDHMEALLSHIKELGGRDCLKPLEASTRLLTVFASYFPSLLDGKEGKLLHLLGKGNEYVKEAMLQMLSKMGGSLQRALMEDPNSVHILETLCIEGSRKQAKFSVQALVGISKDSRILALCRKLVDFLEMDKQLPTVLQSLGCIAQNAISVFETQEEGVVNFLTQDLFRRENVQVQDGHSSSDVTDTTRHKAFGLKMLVRSCLQNKGGNCRERAQRSLEILAKFVKYGNAYEKKRSSDVDKAYLRLEAGKCVLRLSTKWDIEIRPQLFEATVLLARDLSMEIRGQFLERVHQLLKNAELPHRYACAFVLSIPDGFASFPNEAAQHLGDFIESCRGETGQEHPESAFASHPEYLLPYLVYVLAQTADFPSLSEGSPSLEMLQPYFKQLAFFIWLLGPQRIGSLLDIFRAIKCTKDVVNPLKIENAYILCDIGIALIQDLGNFPTSTVSYSGLPVEFYEPIEGVGRISFKPLEDWSHLPLCLKDKSTLKRMKASLPFKIDEIAKEGRRKEDHFLSSESSQSQKSSTADVQDEMVVASEPNTNHDKLKNMESKRSLNALEYSLPISPKGKRSRPNRDASYSGAKHVHPGQRLSKKRMRGRPNDNNATSRDESSSDSLPSKTRNVSRGRRSDKSRSVPDDDEQVHSSIEPLKEAKDGSNRAGEDDHDIVEKHQEDLAGQMDGGMENLKQQKSQGQDRNDDTGKDIKKKPETHETKLSLKEEIEEPEPATPRRANKRKNVSRFEGSSLKSNVKQKGSNEELVGCRIRVWWPLDKQFYKGTIESYNASTKKHKVVYEDGDMEVLKLSTQRWEHLNEGAESGQTNKRTRKNDASISLKDVASSGRLSSPRAQKEPKVAKTSNEDTPESSDAIEGEDIDGVKVEDTKRDDTSGGVTIEDMETGRGGANRCITNEDQEMSDDTRAEIGFVKSATESVRRTRKVKRNLTSKKAGKAARISDQERPKICEDEIDQTDAASEGTAASPDSMSVENQSSSKVDHDESLE